jgi:hypothetical protein
MSQTRYERVESRLTATTIFARFSLFANFLYRRFWSRLRFNKT